MTEWLAGVAVVLLGGGGWLFSLWRHPYAPCRWCNGSGRNPGSRRTRFGTCTHCGGTSRRVRTGARMMRPDMRGK